jgi:RNA polymerase sigma-70 factor (ECF subfamily)
MSDAREEQFRALYDLTRPQIIAYALRRTSSREDAADIVAETYEIAWRRLGDVPAGHAGLLWLYVTARHVLANHGRRVRRRDETTARLAEELRGVPLRTEGLDEDSLVMRSCLNSLSADEQELLMLAGWEGLSAAEIGRVLGCSPTAARIRLHRARVRLKSTIAGLTPPEKQAGFNGHGQGNGAEKSGTPEEVRES